MEGGMQEMGCLPLLRKIDLLKVMSSQGIAPFLDNAITEQKGKGPSKILSWFQVKKRKY